MRWVFLILVLCFWQLTAFSAQQESTDHLSWASASPGPPSSAMGVALDLASPKIFGFTGGAGRKSTDAHAFWPLKISFWRKALFPPKTMFSPAD